MKATVEIPDSLLDEARRVAAREGTTVRALVEEGLRRALAQRKAGAFHLRTVTFKGRGLQPGVADGSWDRMRDLAYEQRGG
ncbi:MAG: type II toxin-antitoxin system VapB family antitoxin [Candidatus Rokubacteria bacterium]|nr:type II toxin-antitoxin system VapB family antitoxin [Candidatus Rokubacteria bacterium]